MRFSDLFRDDFAALQKEHQPAEQKGYSSVLQRLIMSQEGSLGALVSPENCEQAPTVKAIVTAVSRRFAVTPVGVYQKAMKDGRETKTALPDHPVSQLLRRPNAWQSASDYWQDAASTYMRYGNFYSFIGRGSSGKIRELLPLGAGGVTPEQDENTWRVQYRVNQRGTARIYEPDRIFHARMPARDFVNGNSPVKDVANAIALEILAERFGANFFKNGAIPLLIFKYMEGSQGFQTVEQEQQFLKDLKAAFGGDKQLSSMLLPKGIDAPVPANFKADEAQFLETRKLQRSVIAGAWNVPQHIVGMLEDAHYNNIEMQSKEFSQLVILPVAKSFEAAMERDLLSDRDRSSGKVIRFNLDSIMRATFLDRQQGLQIQRQNGIISANEWREREGMNPRDGGDEYIIPANMNTEGEEPEDTENEVESSDTP